MVSVVTGGMVAPVTGSVPDSGAGDPAWRGGGGCCCGGASAAGGGVLRTIPPPPFGWVAPNVIVSSPGNHAYLSVLFRILRPARSQDQSPHCGVRSECMSRP